MELWTPLLLLLGITEPVMTTQVVVQAVTQVAPLVETAQIDQPEPALTPIVIDIKYRAGQRCVIAPRTQMVQRN